MNYIKKLSKVKKMQNNKIKKRRSYRPSDKTKNLIIKAFEKKPYPTKDEQQELAIELDVPISYLFNWFRAERGRYK